MTHAAACPAHGPEEGAEQRGGPSRSAASTMPSSPPSLTTAAPPASGIVMQRLTSPPALWHVPVMHSESEMQSWRPPPFVTHEGGAQRVVTEIPVASVSHPQHTLPPVQSPPVQPAWIPPSGER